MERPPRENTPEPQRESPADASEENDGNGRHVHLSPDNIWYRLRLGR